MRSLLLRLASGDYLDDWESWVRQRPGREATCHLKLSCEAQDAVEI